MTIRAAIGCGLIGLGFVFFCISMIGIFRFKYVLNRMHAAAVSDTLATLCLVLGTVVLRGFCLASAKILLCLVFLWLTGPVATHCITHIEVLTNKELYKEVEVE